ncbi:unnamed protein product [Brachionus calyciflorus]|uniref:Tc1-like transposase DDE domain-containing protein n=1 Tax=Brachionus calyciflorus TaxID=104777 RepID=A0A814S8T2_9BILA|nr:unnamed protein product [Brachionus calyciflorus]
MENPAFINGNTHLQRLASEHGFNFLFCPKYHCELNPIEGAWCFLKGFVRKKDDLDFDKFLELILEAINEFKNIDLNIKLWNRFWRALEMYQSGASYQNFLEKLFGAKSSSKVISHKKAKILIH